MKLKKNNYCTYLYYLYFQGFNGKMGKAFLRHATSCVTTHDSYFQLPGLPFTVSNLRSIVCNLRYLTCVLYNRLFHESDISFYSILFSPFPSIFFSFFIGFPVCVSFVFPLFFPLFPLHFPGVYACAHLPNARVNIIRCTPFRLSSYIREKHVLQHPYNSTL